MKKTKELLFKKEQDELNTYNEMVSSFKNDLIDIEETREQILKDKELRRRI